MTDQVTLLSHGHTCMVQAGLALHQICAHSGVLHQLYSCNAKTIVRQLAAILLVVVVVEFC